MNKRHYEHTLPNIRGSLSNTYKYPKFAVKSRFSGNDKGMAGTRINPVCRPYSYL